MGAGMDKICLEFTRNIGIVDLLLDLTFRRLLVYLDEGQRSLVGFMVMKTI